MKKTLTFLLSPFNNSGIWSSREKYQLSGALVIQIPYSDSCSVSKASARIPRVPLLHGSELKLAEQGFTWDLQLGVKLQPLLSEWRSSRLEVVTEDVGGFQLILTIFPVLPAILSLLRRPKAQGPPPKAWQQTHRGSCYTEAQLLTALHKLPFHRPPGWLAILSFWLSLLLHLPPGLHLPPHWSSNSYSKSLIPQRTRVPLPMIEPWLIHTLSRPQLWEN